MYSLKDDQLKVRCAVKLNVFFKFMSLILPSATNLRSIIRKFQIECQKSDLKINFSLSVTNYFINYMLCKITGILLARRHAINP